MAELARLHSPSEIVIATDEMAPEIERLAKMTNFEFEGWDIDWSRVYPSWLLAYHDGVAVGAVQALPGYPVGRVELLSIDRDQSHDVRVAAIKALWIASCASLAAQGVQGAACTIPSVPSGWRDFVEENFGLIAINEGTIMMARTT